MNIYKRPETIEEGASYLRSSLERQKGKKELQIYSSFWMGMDHILNESSFLKDVLGPMSEKSEVSTFLFKTMCPILEEMICKPEVFESKVQSALSNRDVCIHAKKFYDLSEKMKAACQAGVLREEMGEGLKKSCICLGKMMENEYILESLRLFYMIDFKSRLGLDHVLPKLTRTFIQDTTLTEEKGSFLFFSKFG